jgi:hypothetical protein
MARSALLVLRVLPAPMEWMALPVLREPMARLGLLAPKAMLALKASKEFREFRVKPGLRV